MFFPLCDLVSKGRFMHVFLKNSNRTCPKFCSAFLVERQIKRLNWRILSKRFCSFNSLLSCPDPFSLVCLRLRNPQNLTFF